MTIPATSWDETSPAGSDALSQGDDRLREVKAQIREVVDIDHQFNSSGQDADNGKHVKVSLLEQANLGTGAVGTTLLGSQTVSGKGELLYTDEDDNDIQITDAGFINTAALKDAVVADVAGILTHAYPVGSIYINATNATNPGTLLGFGTWVVFGAGRVPIGIDSGDTDFDAAEETGGAKTVDASHDHAGFTGGVSFTGAVGSDTAGALDTKHRHSIASDGSATQSVVQPYIVVYMWKRTV